MMPGSEGEGAAALEAKAVGRWQEENFLNHANRRIIAG